MNGTFFVDLVSPLMLPDDYYHFSLVEQKFEIVMDFPTNMPTNMPTNTPTNTPTNMPTNMPKRNPADEGEDTDGNQTHDTEFILAMIAIVAGMIS